MKIGVAGSLESNDALVTVSEGVGISVEIKSIVYDFFGEAIKKVVLDTLREKNIENLTVTVEDKGALDYTVRARLISAIARMEGEK